MIRKTITREFEIELTIDDITRELRECGPLHAAWMLKALVEPVTVEGMREVRELVGDEAYSAFAGVVNRIADRVAEAQIEAPQSQLKG